VAKQLTYVIRAEDLQRVIDWYRIEKPYPRSLVIDRLEGLISDAKICRQSQLLVGDYNDMIHDIRETAYQAGRAAGLKTAISRIQRGGK
jgi:hypothetical protein